MLLVPAGQGLTHWPFVMQLSCITAMLEWPCRSDHASPLARTASRITRFLAARGVAPWMQSDRKLRRFRALAARMPQRPDAPANGRGDRPSHR